MKTFILVSVLLGVACSARLDQTYLPPASAKTAGGGGLLPPPVSSYVPPASGPARTPSAEGTYLGLSQSGGGAPVAAVVRISSDNAGDGSYRFGYETENRISHEEQGHLKNVGTDQEANVVQGSYSYTAPDGVKYTVHYIADENGFRATGDHLPTPPPIPAAIQRSLEKSGGGYSDGGYPAPSRQYLAPRSGGYNY